MGKMEFTGNVNFFLGKIWNRLKIKNSAHFQLLGPEMSGSLISGLIN